jgi:hypothetical protein
MQGSWERCAAASHAQSSAPRPDWWARLQESAEASRLLGIGCPRDIASMPSSSRLEAFGFESSRHIVSLGARAGEQISLAKATIGASHGLAQHAVLGCGLPQQHQHQPLCLLDPAEGDLVKW